MHNHQSQIPILDESGAGVGKSRTMVACSQWSEKILRQAGVTVTLAALMDAILVYVYMKWAHPWGAILENEETGNTDGNEAVPNPEPQQIPMPNLF